MNDDTNTKPKIVTSHRIANPTFSNTLFVDASNTDSVDFFVDVYFRLVRDDEIHELCGRFFSSQDFIKFAADVRVAEAKMRTFLSLQERAKSREQKDN